MSNVVERLAPVAPELFVSDVDASIAFYERLGFAVARAEPEGGDKHYFAVIVMGVAEFMLAHQQMWGADLGERGGGIQVRVMVEDVDAAYARAKASGGRIRMEVGDRDYGLRDFQVLDPDGFCIRFASRLKGSP